MVNDATKKFREPLAYGLLAVSGLSFIAALSLLFKGSSVGFATKSALIGGLFESPVAVLCLVVAVLLVTWYGEPSPNARVVVLVALGIAGLDLLFGVITFLAQFGAAQGAGFGAILLAGKVVGAILGLAQLLFLAAASFYLLSAFQDLPAPAVAPQQGQWAGPAGGGFGGYGSGASPPGDQQGWAPPDQGYPPAGQPAWGRPASPYDWAAPDQPPAQGWGGRPAHPGAYGAPAQPWPQQPSAAGGGWQQPAQGGWGQPAATYGEQQASFAETPSDVASAPADPVWGGAPYDDRTYASEPADAPAAPAEEPAARDEEAATDDGSDLADESPAQQPAGDTPETDSGWWQHPRQ